MAGRRIVFRKSKPAAASVAPSPVRVPTAPVLFVKSVTPAPDPLDSVEWMTPITHAQVDILAKAAAAGEIGMDDLARASHASLCRGVVPEDMRRVIVGTHMDPITVKEPR